MPVTGDVTGTLVLSFVWLGEMLGLLGLGATLAVFGLTPPESALRDHYWWSTCSIRDQSESATCKANV